MKENVCIAHEKEENMAYAVGSLSHVYLLETHSGKSVGSLCSSEQGAGKGLFKERVFSTLFSALWRLNCFSHIEILLEFS